MNPPPTICAWPPASSAAASVLFTYFKTGDSGLVLLGFEHNQIELMPCVRAIDIRQACPRGTWEVPGFICRIFERHTLSGDRTDRHRFGQIIMILLDMGLLVFVTRISSYFLNPNSVSIFFRDQQGSKYGSFIHLIFRSTLYISNI